MGSFFVDLIEIKKYIMKKFEYLVVDIDAMEFVQYGDHEVPDNRWIPLMYKLRELSELGEQGWELVSISNSNELIKRGIMKREVE